MRITIDLNSDNTIAGVRFVDAQVALPGSTTMGVAPAAQDAPHDGGAPQLMRGTETAAIQPAMPGAIDAGAAPGR